jgi:predicted metal-dependent phosphoesterase TrpH
MNGSADSALSVPELVHEAARTGLDGVCLTEHRGPWDRLAFAAVQRAHEHMFFVNGMEIDNPDCHLVVFGLDRSIGRGYAPASLRRIADAEGAFVILAHPFRYLLSQPENNLLFRGSGSFPLDIAHLRTHPLLELVDAIEVANGGTSPAENALALEVATALGKPTVGGSDAHSVHGLGRFVTVFDDAFHDSDGFMQALRGGRFRAAVRNTHGALIPCL